MKCDGCKKEIKRYRSFENEKYCYNCYMKHFTRMPSIKFVDKDKK
jgi:hypothetical protein